jgi:dolichyl-phosphate beta-glucosyltransferase
MSASVYLSVVLPAYNEAGSIRTTLAAMRSFLDRQDYSYEIIVAADGDDNTPEIVTELARDWPALKLTAEAGRHGKGHGLRRGMRMVTGEIVGFLDADYKTPIDEATKLLPWLRQGYDVVIGSRALGDSRVEIQQPWYRRWGSRGFALAMHGIVGLHHIRDTQCGFKFFRGSLARRVWAETRIDGFSFDVEVLGRTQLLGATIAEFPVTWVDVPGSTFSPARHGVESFRELAEIRLLLARASGRRAAPVLSGIVLSEPPVADIALDA